MIIKDAISDIELRLGQNTSDRKIPRKLIKHWIAMVTDEVIDEELDEEEEEINPNILTRFECVAIEVKQLECDDCETKTVVTLPVDVKSLSEDRGVYSVERIGGKLIDRQGTPGQANLVSKTQFAPAEYWYRINKEIYLVGKFPPSMKVHLNLVTTDLEELDEDTKVPNPRSDREILDRVEAIGRRMLGTPEDKLADGVDEKIS